MTAVSEAGIRSGDPDALAGLCQRRGGAVLVYAEHVAAPGQAGSAAADAFARFRAQVVAGDGPRLDAESLLLSTTRHAAAARGLRARPGNGGEPNPDCPAEALLIGWIEETLSAPERERFEQHVVDCPDCVGTVARFEAAERAYEDPPRAPLPANIAHQILGALVASAPVTALNGDAAAVREAAENGIVLDTPPPSFEGEMTPAADAEWPSSEPETPAIAASAALAWPADPRIAAAVDTDASPQWPAEPRADGPSDDGREIRASAAQLIRASGGRPTRASASERAANAGDALVQRFDGFAKRGRRVAERRPRLQLARPRLALRMGRRTLLGVALTSVLALITAVALLTSGGPSAPSDQPASSAADRSPPSSPAADASQSALSEQPPAATPKPSEPKAADKPKPKAPAKPSAARPSAAKRSADQAQARRAARRREAATAPAKRRSRDASPRKSAPAKPTPSRQRKPATTPPAARRPAPAPRPKPISPPTPKPAPSLGGKAPAPPAPSLGGSDAPPGGEFSVGGET